jgi:hypothetical protein
MWGVVSTFAFWKGNKTYRILKSHRIQFRCTYTFCWDYEFHGSIHSIGPWYLLDGENLMLQNHGTCKSEAMKPFTAECH